MNCLLSPGCGSGSGPSGPSTFSSPDLLGSRAFVSADAGGAAISDAAQSATHNAEVTAYDAALVTLADAASDAALETQASHPSAPDPFSAAATCTSGAFWFGTRDERMHPGRACIECHLHGAGYGRAPAFSLGGTTYPTAHEPDDCNAALPGNVRVEIRDAKGRRFELPVNGAGNFFTLEPIALPYTARVIHAGRSRAMHTPQHSGDCNACHSQAGSNGAPGRILLP